MQLDLTPEEEEALNVEIRGVGAKSISHYAASWERFVADVEQGYRLTIYDYTNDLTLREILGRALSAARGWPRRKLTAFLDATDARFKAATVTATKPVFPGAYLRNPTAWWYMRVPTKLTGELKRSVEAEGILSALGRH
jgi:hypothetical protein